MDLKVLIFVYASLLGLNLFYCALLWFKTKEQHYKIQSFTYLFFFMTLNLQALTSNQVGLIKALSASTVFFAFLAFSHLLGIITKTIFPFKHFLLFYFMGALLSTLLYFGGVDENIMPLPCLLGAVYPIVYKAYFLYKDPQVDLTFSVKCFLWSGIVYSCHMLDYAYFINRPEWGVIGFSIAIVCILGFFMFSHAAVMESIVEENTKIKLQVKYKAMLTNSYKLASLGEMAAGVAHEINNPLTVIQLHADALKRLIKKGSLGPESSQQRFEAITNSVNRIVKVITNLRYFSRDSSQDAMTEASIEAVIHQTLTFCQVRFMEKGVEIKSGPIPDLKVSCRPVQLAQALLNLLNNSFEAVVKSTTLPKLIKIEVRSFGKKVEIRISDSGPGIPEGIRHKIYDPFFSTKDIGEGMGLGLSVSMGMIESQHGDLRLDESVPETCFVIQLPLVSQ